MLIAIYSLQTGLICEGKTFLLSSNLWPPRTKKNWQVNSCTFLNGSGHWIQLRLLFVREHKRYQENSKGIRFIVFASALNLLMSIFNFAFSALDLFVCCQVCLYRACREIRPANSSFSSLKALSSGILSCFVWCVCFVFYSIIFIPLPD